MSRTVVVISESGRLIDVTGQDQEDNSHYLKFANRLLGEDGSYAILNYGWNNDVKLKITGAGGARGQEIVLDANNVVIPGTLKVNGKTLQSIISDDVDLAITGIRGTQGQIVATPSDNPQASQSGQPRKLCTISLSEDFIDRIETLEEQVEGLFRFDEVYYAGDGLVTDQSAHRIDVLLGNGLKFEQQEYEVPDENPLASPSVITKNAVVVDCDTVPHQDSIKPITSGAVYNAVAGATDRYMIDIDSVTGNVVLYDRQGV